MLLVGLATLLSLPLISQFSLTSEPGRVVKIPPHAAMHYNSFVQHVANDGANVLGGTTGYRLDRKYRLVSDYYERKVFPQEERAQIEAKYKVNTIEASLEDDVALAMLRPASSTRDRVSSRTWAVFPIDLRADPRPTDILHTTGNARLVSASIKGRRLNMTVAENVTPTRIILVDYVFRLAPRKSSGVNEAGIVRRTQSSRGYFLPLSETGEPLESSRIGPGKVSKDRTRIILGQEVRSLLNRTSVEHHFGQIEGSAHLYFVGNTLFQTVSGRMATAHRTRGYNPGINQFVDGKWVRVSDLILEAISANGRFVALKRLPEEAMGTPTWYVLDLKR